MSARAVFPGVPHAAGHYESFFLRASAPGGRTAVWIRYTVHKPPGRPANGSLWFTWFDAESRMPRASKVTQSHPRAGEGAFVHIGSARFGPDEVVGACETDRCRASWQLRIRPSAPPLEHLPYGWMYRAPFPRTKLTAPAPAARFDGRLVIDGREVLVDGWRGTVGHNWGAQHAERWIWLHGVGFEQAPDAWLDVAVARVRLGPATLPWIASGALFLNGSLHRLGGPLRVGSTRVSESPTRCEFTLPGDGLLLRGEVFAAPKHIVGWRYADPGGSEHQVLHCSIAELSLSVDRRGHPIALTLSGGAAYEVGVREGNHGVPLEPFPDG